METDGVIRVYVCPKPGCESYFGSSSMGKLEDNLTKDLRDKSSRPRSICPQCGTPRQERWAWLIPQDHVKTVIAEAGIKR